MKDSNGYNRSKVHTYWTQKGRLFIYDLLKSKRHLTKN
ncbi:phage antirepressor KilAC domain-containing protein [Paracerasibacillus soli]